MISKKLLGGAALMALMAAPPAIAQQTTSSLRGEVLSESGSPIGGATVVLTHTPSGTRSTQKTEGNGVFDLRGLRVGGPYHVEITAPNYSSQSVDDVYLGLGGVAGFAVNLQPAGEVITVTGTRRPLSRLADPGSRSTIGRDGINGVVSTRRDIRDIARRDPLVTLDNVTRGTGPAGGIYIAGSTPRLNRITIDGVRSADDFGLNTGGLSTTRGPISPEAIEQLSVQAVPFDVEEGDFTGGAVNIVLRGGGNDFHGSAFGSYINDGMVGTHLWHAPAPITTDLQNYGLFFSGPIFKDKLFFAASYEYYKALDATTLPGPVDAGFVNPINGIAHPPATTDASKVPKLTTVDLAPFYAAWDGYATSSKLSPGGFPLYTPTRDIKDSLRIDYNLTDDQRIQAIYRHAESSLTKPFSSSTSAAPISNWYIQAELEDNYSLQLNSSWTQAFSTEIRGSYRSYIRHQDPPEGQDFAQITVCTDDRSSGNLFSCGAGSSSNGELLNTSPLSQPSFIFGPDQFRQANLLKTQNLSADATGTYLLGDHKLKAGAQSKSIDIFNVFVVQARGLYYFDSLADFNAGKAGRFQYGNNPGGDPNTAAAAFNYNVSSGFVQDSWSVSDKLTLNGGVRYDRYSMDNKPALNANFVLRNGFDNQTTYDGLDVLMPRVSFKYDATDKMQLSGGVGLFSGGLPDVFLSNRFSNTGVLTNQIDIQRFTSLNAGGTHYTEANSGAAIADSVGDALLNINKASPTFASGIPVQATPLLANVNTATFRTAETNSFAKNFEMPSDWKANFAYKLDAFGVSFGADAVFTRSNEAVAFRDIRARPLTINGVQQYTPDGRIRYDGLNIPLASRQTQGLPINTNADYTNLGNNRDIQAYNPDEESWNQTFALSAYKVWDKLGLDVGLAWVVQNAKNYGTITEFATTDSGFYNDQFSAEDPNTSTSGTASNRIKNEFKLNVGFKKNLFGSLASKFTLFGESRSGRPFSFVATDVSSRSRGPVFGVNRSDQLLYVPDYNNPVAGNPLKFQSPTGVTVFFDSLATLDNFKSIANHWDLPVNQISPKGFGENPQVNQVDFQFDQELPGFFKEHHTHLTFDFKNVLNLINQNWGLIREYGDSRGGTGNRLVSVSCADMGGAPLGETVAACPAYRYSNFNSSTGSVGSGKANLDTASRWAIQVGLKYAF